MGYERSPGRSRHSSDRAPLLVRAACAAWTRAASRTRAMVGATRQRRRQRSQCGTRPPQAPRHWRKGAPQTRVPGSGRWHSRKSTHVAGSLPSRPLFSLETYRLLTQISYLIETFGENACHPERSEGSGEPAGEILRCAQDDRQDLSHVRSREVLSPNVCILYGTMEIDEN